MRVLAVLAVTVFCWMAVCSGSCGADQLFPEGGRKYYALLIGQSYTDGDAPGPLSASSADIVAFENMLTAMRGTPYHTEVRYDLNAGEILSGISAAFSSAEEGDLCLLYYSGHGKNSAEEARRGILTGTDGAGISADLLLDTLDPVPGDKVILLDSCYSGMLSSLLKSRGGGSGRYAVLTAASETEEAYNGRTAKGEYGWFTSAVLLGSGYQELTGKTLPQLPADQDGDGALSLRELWRFTADYLAGLSASQHPQLYLPEEDLIILAR